MKKKTLSIVTFIAGLALLGNCTDYADFMRGATSDFSSSGGTQTTATPTFSPAAGIYDSDQQVTISTTTASAVIYYTTDGSEPTTSVGGSTLQYSAPIAINGDGIQTLKAIAVKAGMKDSAIAIAVYNIEYPTEHETTFSEVMDIAVTPTLQSEAFNVSGWTTIPTTNASVSWINPTTLSWDTGWIKLPENTRLRFTISGLQDAGGNPITDTVEEIQTSGRNNMRPIADTGQTRCFYYNATLGIISSDTTCSNDYPNPDDGVAFDTDYPWGQDAHYTGTRSIGKTSDDTYGDYITTDNVTELVWKTCSEGLSGADCTTGSASEMNWYDAIDACSYLNGANSGNGYAGLKDWRLPTRSELESLPNYDNYNPAIDSEAFPVTPSSGVTWTSTTRALSMNSAWNIHFNASVISNNTKETIGYVRCVSSGDSLTPKTFNDNGDGTVTDNTTNLVWQKCSMGQNDDATCSGTVATAIWQDAMQYCEELTLAGRNWRLPDINELKSIVDTTKATAPLIDSTFPATPSSGYTYWSSTTTIPNSSTHVRGVYFSDGSVNIRARNNSSYTRCVTDE